MTGLTIVWDVDDVLNELTHEWFRQEWLPTHPACAITYAGLTENPPHVLLGVSKDEYLRSLDVFRNSHMGRMLIPNRDVLSWFRTHGSQFRHAALTSRPLHTVPVLAEWMFSHFGAWIRTFSFVPSRAVVDMPQYDGSKKEFLQWFGKADILVDDSQENIAAAVSLGMRGILVPRPWNMARGSIPEALSKIVLG